MEPQNAMPARNLLLTSPPHQVEQVVATLGRNIKTARLRRNLSLEDVAAKVGLERHVVGDAERGKLSTGIAVYVALLWVLGLIDQMAHVADPQNDTEGQLLARGRDRANASRRAVLDNDF